MQFNGKTQKYIGPAVLLAIVVVAGLLGWLYRAGGPAPNLLANPDFENGLNGWETVENGGNLTLKPAVDNAGNTVAALSIPTVGRETAWVALATQINSLAPGQQYEISAEYRLPQPGQSPARVVWRVLQLDRRGNLLKQEEFSNPNPLATGLDETGRLAWNTAAYSFVAEDRAASAKIYLALLGQQATRLEVNRVSVRPAGEPAWLQPAKTGLFVLLALLLAGGIVGYARYSPSPAARQIKKWGPVVVVNLLVFVVLAELAALGFYFIRDHHLFYTHKKPVELIGSSEENIDRPDNLAENLTARRFHPFFGFVVQPGADERFNNYGFISPYNYPYTKTGNNQFVIGIFGGSVAQIFTFQDNQARFVDRLKQDPFFQDKEIVILNFAAGAYKQPQQLLVLNYFLSIGQQFDLVINIDGFNEASMSYINYQNGVDVSMPVSFIMLPLVNLTGRTTPSADTVELLAQTNRLKTRLNSLARTINRNSSAFVNVVLEQYYAYTLHRYRAGLAALEQAKSNVATSLIYVNPVEEKADEALVFREIAQTWANASIQMNQVLAGRGVPYLHILQPNQYYSNRQFSQAEAAIALNPDQVYRVGAEKGYPYLVEQFDTLTRRGVNFYSGLEIFDTEPEPVYGDDCCHFNDRGNEILAQFVAGHTLELLHKNQ